MTGSATGPAGQGGRRPRPAIRVHALGAYANRQPFAYAPIREVCAPAIAMTDRPEAADVLILAHWKDVAAFGQGTEAGRLRLGQGQRLVLLSEEPFWDTLWTPQPYRRHRRLPGGAALTVLNHGTSPIFAFRRLPYFPLTDPRFAARYAEWFARNAAVDEVEWLTRLTGAPYVAAFLFERRIHPAHDARFPEVGVMGLAAHRTRIAEAMSGPHVLRAGLGWGAGPRRQELADWHLDKFHRLDGKARTISALENTHQANYVTEKLFDAYAMGGVPLYLASPEHRVHGLVPEGSWLDLTGLSPHAAAARICAFTPDRAFVERYRAAQAGLAALWSDSAVRAAEYARLADLLHAELAAVLATDDRAP